MTRARIEDYGLLSDCQSAALVGRDGSVDWWCPPRFDGPSVFARLLDDDAGNWSIRPDASFTASRSYVGPSLVLRTVFHAQGGAVAVTDALALDPTARGHDIGRRVPRVLVRLVEGLDGEVAMRTRFAPRFEYGRTVPRLRQTGRSVVAAGGPATLLLDTTVPLTCQDGTATAVFTVMPGQAVGFCLAYAPTYGAARPARLDPGAAVQDTIAGWASWTELHQGYQGRYRELVQRSALVLQGLTYQPSGAVLAAATTSLPERLGGERNYDYRFAWLRDLTLTMRALWVAACPGEADRLFAWIAQAAGQLGDEPIQIVYGPEGERDLAERTLEHLRGFADSRPVRVGNDAWRQRQLDVPGEVLDAAHLLRDQLGPLDPETQALLVALADQTAEGWRKPDAGMWEARDTERHYLSSKVLCWVALDRAVRFAPDLGERADPQRWAEARAQVRRAVLEQGWNDQAGAYTGAFDSEHLDASVLILPLVGFLPATDPRMRATIDAIERDLGRDGLVYRWRGDTAGFFICSYWLVECLALAGESERATAWFEQINRYANDLGLLSEEADPVSGAQLGNFPQAFSHVGLINAAWRLTQPHPARPGWTPTDQEDTTMAGRLNGKVALITGSDSGIGQGTAIDFAKEGADLVVHYLEDRDGAERTRTHVEREGRRAIVVQGDISDEQQVAELFDQAVQTFGTVDILVNNAGVDASGTQVAELDTATWDRAIRVNLYGAFFCCRRFIQLRKQAGGGGKIINVTSVHQEIPRAGAADYDCAKGALRNLTTTLALELAPLKINVNNLAPGMVLTPFNQEAVDDPKVREEQVQSIPWKRAAEPAEIGRLATFLASRDADYVTGSTYYIDGGLMQNQGQGA